MTKSGGSLCVQRRSCLSRWIIAPGTKSVPLVAAKNANRRADASGQQQLDEQPGEKRSFHTACEAA
ncbi:MAG: hypothetical protein DME24_02885 [Verrucomicrobia bacterium]|nr:MAG: hypothetical protein DME24_02885 [Verrucomicrobiota bacterium]